MNLPNHSPPAPRRLLLAVADAALQDILAGVLASQGYAVLHAQLPDAQPPDARLELAIVQVERPERRPASLDADGGAGDTLGFLSGAALPACRALQAAGVPVILLAPAGSDGPALLHAAAASACLLLPLSVRELLARVEVLLAPAAPVPDTAEPAPRLLRIGSYVFDPASPCLRRGRDVHLLGTVEHALLAELARQPGVAVSRERLQAASHENGEPILPRAVDGAMLRLRRLVEPKPAAPRYLRTARGHGYLLLADAERG